MEADGSPFSGMVSMIGVHYEDKCVCTGFASHLALPMLRERAGEAMGEAEAKQLMQDALRVRLRACCCLCRALPVPCARGSVFVGWR